MNETYIGIEIGGTKLQIVVGDESCKIKERFRFNIDKEKGATGIQEHINNTLHQILLKYQPVAIGVGFGGPVNIYTGQISQSFHIDGWSDFNLAKWINQITMLPVYVENDGSTAALGEAMQGAGVNHEHVFYVTMGSGVGGGSVRNKEIFHGAVPGEAEIGHILLDRTGSTLQTKCSGWAVDEKVRELIKNNPGGILSQLANGVTAGEAKFLLPALQAGDLLAQDILNETAQDFAFGLSHVVHLFHPEIIILGGGLSHIGAPLREAVEQNLKPYVMNAFLPGPDVILTKLGEDAVPVGALELAKHHFQLQKATN